MSDGYPNKWEKILKKIPDWCSGAESKTTEELKQEVLKQQGILADVEHVMSNDAKLIAVSEELKNLRHDYREQTTDAQAKSAFCLYLLRSRGSKPSD